MLLSAVSDYNGFYAVVQLSAITIDFMLLSCCQRLQLILCCCAAVSDYNRFYIVVLLSSITMYLCCCAAVSDYNRFYAVVLLSAITMDFMLLCCCQRLQ